MMILMRSNICMLLWCGQECSGNCMRMNMNVVMVCHGLRTRGPGNRMPSTLDAV